MKARSRTFALDVALLLAVVLVAVATRFYQLGTESLWGDEGITFARARLDLPKLIHDSTTHFHNPTYFLLVHFWMKLGDDELMLRFPSAFFGVLKVIGVYAIARVAAGRWAGLCAAVVICLLPGVLHYDQEARMYAFYGFGASLAIGAVIWLMNRPDAAALRIWRMKRDLTADQPSGTIGAARGAWLAFIVGCIIALYAHGTGVLFVTACSVVALVFLASYPQHRSGFVVNWILVNLLVILAFSPWIPSLLGQTDALEKRGFWLDPPTFDGVMRALRQVFFFAKSPVASGMVLGFALAGTWALRRKPRVLTSLWLFTMLGPVLLLLVSLREPMFMARLFLWSTIPFAVLVGAGLASLWPCLSVGSMTLLLVLGGNTLYSDYYAVDTKPRWREAIQYLSDNAGPKTVVLAIARRETRLLGYYLERKTAPIPRFRYAARLDAMVSNRRLDKLIGNANTVLTLQGRDFVTSDKIKKLLSARGRRVSRKSYGKKVVVERYAIRAKKTKR